MDRSFLHSALNAPKQGMKLVKVGARLGLHEIASLLPLVRFGQNNKRPLALLEFIDRNKNHANASLRCFPCPNSRHALLISDDEPIAL